MQGAVTKLVHLASRDSELISTSLGMVRISDKFTDSLMKTWESASQSADHANKPNFVFLRNDFMIHAPPDRDDYAIEELALHNVEINTIAASFGMLSSKISQMQRTVLPRLLGAQGVAIAAKIPENDVGPSVCAAFKVCCFSIYCLVLFASHLRYLS